jgi:hypothetical protein
VSCLAPYDAATDPLTRCEGSPIVRAAYGIAPGESDVF